MRSPYSVMNDSDNNGVNDRERNVNDQNDAKRQPKKKHLPLHDTRKTVNNQERTPWEPRDTHEEPNNK